MVILKIRKEKEERGLINTKNEGEKEEEVRDHEDEREKISRRKNGKKEGEKYVF